MSLLTALWGVCLLASGHAVAATEAASNTVSLMPQGGLLGSLPPAGGPVKVTVRFDLRDIDHIDDDEESFEFTGVVKSTWHDPRQVFDPALEGTDEKVFQGDFQFNEVFEGWFPQLILVNESGMFDKRGVLLRVRSDGTLSLYETINAVAKIDLDLRRYPFDHQQLDATFHVLGFDNTEIELVLDDEFRSGHLDEGQSIRMPQWHLADVRYFTGTRNTPLIASGATASTFTASIHVERNSFFILRLVVLPLIVIVILSWCVFWMDKSSVGDRLSISFIGILTAVTYQVILSEILPRISYPTLINDGFLFVSLFVMTMTVMVNLRVGYLDRHGESRAGDQLDHLCRWLFPVTYFGALLVMCLVAYA